MKLPLSVAVITLNEEDNIGRCLESVKDIAAEVVVVDSGSTDQTAHIAQQYGSRFLFNQWPGHVKQKNFALQQCTQPWVLSLDADECLTPELAQAVRDLFQSGEPRLDGYQLNRRTEYLGKWIWHAWYPEWRLRLVRREKAEWQGRDPHDKLSVSGSSAKLKGGDFLHYTYRDFSHHMEQTIKYARIGAQAALDRGETFKGRKLLLSPIGRILKMMIRRQAWRDGWRGMIITFSSAMSAFLKYAYMYEEKVRKLH
ncbi:glycosyltransferase family 2 protein [Desulfurispira natronophila]|uniref:Glycosyltransferase involved in cell wall biosynthesis n=1 Tax=Desulfurispira natronophila TaxID=682562 RepID=A0A7W7Y4E2_9BACT|nr:glycosyltransferase family 2 protein [Desulfurispira natronophila]MBB5021880.1 glycosyltransferase involved in cell wall biosynthesis [Desulfurispira natronophila]